MHQFKTAFTFFFLGFNTVSANFCDTLHSDFTRRQLLEHGSETPYDLTSGAKHTPFITIEDGLAKVTVGDGNPYHPMSASDDPNMVHFVTHIYVMDQDENMVFMETLDPVQGAPAVSAFEIPTGATSLTAYEWCNLHGLWVGPTVAVTVEGTGSGICTNDQPELNAWPSIHADLLRLQSMPPFESIEPYTELNGAKHTPYITLSEDKSMGSVVVGTEAVYHPMVEGSRPHWVTSIYITDEMDNIIAMESLDPKDVDKAEMSFEIPEGVKELTAWEFCNLHGLWKGPTVSVASDEEIVEVADSEPEVMEEEEEAEEEATSIAARASMSVLVATVALFAYL